MPNHEETARLLKKGGRFDFHSRFDSLRLKVDLTHSDATVFGETSGIDATNHTVGATTNGQLDPNTERDQTE